MPITLNPPIVITAHKREGESASQALAFLPASADNIRYDGMTVKEALDELFSAFSPPLPERGWQKFTESGEFVAPEGVSRVLVLCIAAGASTNNSMGGGTFVSRYLSVTPGTPVPVVVGKPQAKGTAVKTQLQSSFNGTSLLADYRGMYTVDGTGYTYTNGQNPTFPPELDGAGLVTVARQLYINPGYASAGSGGYAVAADVPDERAAWLELARDMPPGTTPSGRTCYPDTSQMGTAASGKKAGNGASYGGSAGRYSNGQGYSSYAGTGGDGLVCVFWGDDIEKGAEVPQAASPIAYRKEDATSLTPLTMLAEASSIPYSNEEAGLTGDKTVKDALDALFSRLGAKESA